MAKGLEEMNGSSSILTMKSFSNGRDTRALYSHPTDQDVSVAEIALTTHDTGGRHGEDKDTAALLGGGGVGSDVVEVSLEDDPPPSPEHSWASRMVGALLKRPFFLIMAAILGVLSTWTFVSYLYQDHQVIKACTNRLLTMPSVADMTLKEKIAQMVIVDADDIGDGRDLTGHGFGAVVVRAGFQPKQGSTLEAWRNLLGNFQARAIRTRLKIPVVVAAEAYHGMALAPGTTVFPHQVGLGATWDPALVQQVFKAAGEEMAALGVRWAFSPSLDVCRDVRWGGCARAFAEQRNLSTLLTTAVDGLAGYHNDSAWNGVTTNSTLVAGCASHFMGSLGLTLGEPERNLNLTKSEFKHLYFGPFFEAMSRGVASLMMADLKWNGTPIHADGNVVWTWLREQFGFAGVIVSDYRGLDLIPGRWEDKVILGVNSGIDMFQVGHNNGLAFTRAVYEGVRAGAIKEGRVDGAVHHILTMKRRLGLFESPCEPPASHPGATLANVRSAEHTQLARRAVAQSLVLLKNEGEGGGVPLLPVSLEGKTLLVAGSHADNLGFQCGGYTIAAEGGDGAITQGTTILEGIKQVLPPSAKVTFKPQPKGVEIADVGLVVVGEKPYSDTTGTVGLSDELALSLAPKDEDAILAVCEKMPCIVVLVTGRPLTIEHLLESIDALVVAWLPGTEGGGIADVLFGTEEFAGRLSRTWFRKFSQLPMTVDTWPGNATDDGVNGPLFPHGFGLTKIGRLLGKPESVTPNSAPAPSP